MKDMELAAGRILQAVSRREKILVYGDYDVDGITATVVLKRAIEMLGGEVDFYIPKRLEEGYGVRKEPLRQAWERGFKLVVTVDSGIRAFEACEAARHFGLDLIITDHHLPDHELPAAVAVLNPRRADCGYPDKNLAAVGVVFKLIQALFERTGRSSVLIHFLKLVAIGTIGDIVPLLGENRLFVKFGLDGLAEPRNHGLKALLNGSGVEGRVNLFDIAFKLAPRINAVTRMGGGREIVELFSIDNYDLAEATVQQMNQKNAKRQKEEQRILAEIEEHFRESPQDFARRVLVVAGRGWHRGVIGIVASRLMERFHRPVLVFSIDQPYSQASGRSIPGFHLLEALDDCRDLLVQHGGHAQAVGCTVLTDRIPELTVRLDNIARLVLGDELPPPMLQIDSMLPITSVSLDLWNDLEQLAPFGSGNPLPVFASKQVDIAAGPWVLKEQHLKFQVRSNGSRLNAIWWKNGSLADTIRTGQFFDFAYTLTRETYQGEDRLLLTIRDIRHAP